MKRRKRVFKDKYPSNIDIDVQNLSHIEKLDIII